MLEAKTQTRATLARVIFRNTVFLTLGTVALKVINFVFNVYVVRRLGDERFGQYSTVLAFVGLFQIFAELGLTQYVMREIAQDRSKADKLFWNLVVLRLMLAVLGVVGITSGAVVAGYSPQIVLGVFLVTFGFVFSAFDAPLETVLRANEKLGHVAGYNVVAQLVFVVFGTIFLFSGFGFISLIVANLLGIPIKTGLELWTIRRHHLSNLGFQVEPRLWPDLIRSGLPFGVISLALAVAYSIDTVMLSMFEPDQVVGWYNVGYRLIFNLMFFIGGFEDAIVPTLSRAYVSEPGAVEKWYYRTVKYIIILALPIAMGGMILAFPIIRFLYKDEFLPAAVGLQILIWDVPLLMFNSFCGNITTVVCEERAAARIYTINAIANVVLNLYAIPRYGLVGAALVTVVTDFVGMIQFHFLLKKKLNLPAMSSILWRASLATLIMGGVVYLLRIWNLLVVIILGAGLYGGLVLLFKLVDDQEYLLVKGALQRFSRLRMSQESRG
jgi:O-antigen/teichoic acid export membrane protein